VSELEFYEFALIFQWVNDEMSTDPNNLVKILKKKFRLIRPYIHSFKKHTSRTILHHINLDNFKVFLYTRGCSFNNTFYLHDIIFDSSLLSNLSPESAAFIGYWYGKNYNEMIKKSDGRIFNYMIRNNSIFNNQLISLGRNNYISFLSKSITGNKQYSMLPFEIINRKHIINGFHPIHACYIGILVGIKN
jgi:hypothetical protein